MILGSRTSIRAMPLQKEEGKTGQEEGRDGWMEEGEGRGGPATWSLGPAARARARDDPTAIITALGTEKER